MWRYSGSSSYYGTTLPRLVATGIVVVKMFFICHVIQQPHMMNGSCDFMINILKKEVTSLPRLVALGTVAVEI